MAWPVVPGLGVAVPLCLMLRAFVGRDGGPNSGTTIGPGTPAGAWWMWPAMKFSWPGLLMWVLYSIVPSRRTLISVWPFAVDVVGGVSFWARSFACRTQTTPLPLPPLPPFATAPLDASAASAHAATRHRITRRMQPPSFGCPLSLSDLPRAGVLLTGGAAAFAGDLRAPNGFGHRDRTRKPRRETVAHVLPREDELDAAAIRDERQHVRISPRRRELRNLPPPRGAPDAADGECLPLDAERGAEPRNDPAEPRRVPFERVLRCTDESAPPASPRDNLQARLRYKGGALLQAPQPKKTDRAER